MSGKGSRQPEWHPAFEEYCEAIWELHEDDLDVKQARIAERLDVSRAAVSEMVKRMEVNGLVEIGTTIELTGKGRGIAEQVVRRHRLAERFLTDVLRLSWAEAHREAGKWEHVISPVVEDAMNRLLGDPTTCPHGNPIPGTAYEPGATRQLSEVRVGERFLVVRIPEELEFAEGMLDFLEESALLPGRVGVLAAAADDGSRTVEIDGHHVGIEPFVSERILVAAG